MKFCQNQLKAQRGTFSEAFLSFSTSLASFAKRFCDKHSRVMNKDHVLTFVMIVSKHLHFHCIGRPLCHKADFVASCGTGPAQSVGTALHHDWYD